jgi:hypothetical protein
MELIINLNVLLDRTDLQNLASNKKQGVIGLKKIISLLLAVAIIITFMAPVLASSSTSADMGLENAIKAVKEKIVIPKDYNKFTYNINNQDGLNSWNLGWNNEESQKFINVTIDENNMITNYYSYQYTAFEKKIPTYSKEQGRVIGEKFINKLNPKLLSQFKLNENDANTYYSDREYNFSYTRQKDGINYAMNNINVIVNSYTGEVTNYNCNYSKNTSFEDTSKVISIEQAKKAFIEKLGLKMVYNVKTENGKTVTYLAYIPKNSYKYIDAITGDVETTDSRYGIYYDSAKMSEKMSYSGADSIVALTPDEVDAIKGMSGLMSKDDVDKQLRATSFFNLDSEFTITNGYLSKDWRNNESLIWYLNYTKIINKDTNETRQVTVSVDAKSGDIQNFWTYYPAVKDAKPQKTEEQAKVICDDVLKSLLPSNYANFKHDDSYNNYVDSTQNQFSFRYVRVENGLDCPSNYINITYDNLSGNVSNMDSNWTKNLKFDAPKSTISIDKAYEVLFSKIGFSLQYINDYSKETLEKTVIPQQVNTSKAVLGYLIDTSKPTIISATTGDILNYTGDIYKQKNISDYTDIKGLKAENQIKILTQMSIRYRQDQLKPNDSLLQKDYFLLLSKLNDQYYFDQSLGEDKAIEQMYNSLISQGVITKAEKAPLSTITKEDAAKYFVKFLRFGQIAEIKGIYKSDFKDTNKINPDLIGYVCIASGLKAISAEKGNFNPKSKITRLEGLMGIYSYLSNK